MCRTSRPKRDLLRVVRTPDRRVVIDETGRLPGRGAYLCREGDCRTTGIQRGALSRALETPLPPELRAAFEAGATTMNEGGAGGQE
ncbi:MAG TPA: YlxR family protein [Candidatus Limnocylindrales bacterium]